MNDADYPALFRSADAASNSAQSLFLRLVVLEFGLLFLGSVLSLNGVYGNEVNLAYAGIFVVLILVLVLRSFSKAQQDWYKARALAESVKTLSWRYMMRAEPFADDKGLIAARAEFRNQLVRILRQDRTTAERLVPDASGEDQVTATMDRVRGLVLDERRQIYLSQRVDDQRQWYAKKAIWNRDRSRLWLLIGCVAYAAAGALALSRLIIPSWTIWPIEPLLVIGASILGWTQVRKYTELTAAYGVTAHEIGLIRVDADQAVSDDKLSDFVNDAERAFSREHTLWLARQTE